MDKKLDGGRDGIYKDKNTVLRPASEWTEHVHDFLRFLNDSGFDKVPIPYEINGDGREKVSYVEGDVHNEALPEQAKSDAALVSFCRLIREYHDLGAKYINQLSGNETWMLPVNLPVETMCHGDLGPYNIAMKGAKAIGIIDFDTLHPGSRLWDLAYAFYRWVPLMSEGNPEDFGSMEDKSRRMKLFLTSYGRQDLSRDDMVQAAITRIEYLVQFMKQEAANGNKAFQKNIEDGHAMQYMKDIDYIRRTFC